MRKAARRQADRLDATAAHQLHARSWYPEVFGCRHLPIAPIGRVSDLISCEINWARPRLNEAAKMHSQVFMRVLRLSNISMARGLFDEALLHQNGEHPGPTECGVS
jgi:hypothetical protein